MEILTPATLGRRRGPIKKHTINVGAQGLFTITESAAKRITSGGEFNMLFLAFTINECDNQPYVAFSEDGFRARKKTNSNGTTTSFVFASSALRDKLVSAFEIVGNFSMNILPEPCELPGSNRKWFRLEIKKKEV